MKLTGVVVLADIAMVFSRDPRRKLIHQLNHNAMAKNCLLQVSSQWLSSLGHETGQAPSCAELLVNPRDGGRQEF
jgi:hypothetical protein